MGAGTVVEFGRTTGAPGRPRRGASARSRARAGRALRPGATPRPAGENDSPLPTIPSQEVSFFPGPVYTELKLLPMAEPLVSDNCRYVTSQDLIIFGDSEEKTNIKWLYWRLHHLIHELR